jgi:signal transduction histidine kinase
MKDEFLMTVSHELRTPLTAIYGWARMLVTGQIRDDQRQRAIEIIERNAQAQTQLVNDLLDVSRAISGKVRLDVGAVDLGQVISAAIDSMQPAADAKSIGLEITIEPNLGPIIGDRERLQQVVWNLLSNAIKFTSRGGKVQLRLSQVDSLIEIAVSDTGRGIAPDFLPFVFDRFRQSDATFSREQGGLGLGLSIAKQLTELHGGTISASSDGIGRGASFTVRLPLMIVHRAEEPRGPRTQPHADRMVPTLENQPRLDGIHVLAVDDDADSLSLLRTVLEGAGATVATADSAAGALDAMRQRRDGR